MAHFYRFNPPVISQGDAAQCWAAALQSWLKCMLWAGRASTGEWSGAGPQKLGFAGLSWERKDMRLQDMFNQWGDFTNNDHSIEPEGIKQIALDVGMEGSLLRPGALLLSSLMSKLHSNGHLYVVYFSNVMYHAVVGYGVSDTDGLAVMDPASGVGLTHRKIPFFQAPNRAAKTMFVGWPVAR